MTATSAQLLAWVRRNVLLIVTTLTATAFVAVMVVSTLRTYDERQERLAAIEALSAENERQNIEQCEGINDSNTTLRELLDASLRRRTAPLDEEARQITIDTYRRLPNTDCQTGAKTYFNPPFPPG